MLEGISRSKCVGLDRKKTLKAKANGQTRQAQQFMAYIRESLLSGGCLRLNSLFLGEGEGDGAYFLWSLQSQLHDTFTYLEIKVAFNSNNGNSNERLLHSDTVCFFFLGGGEKKVGVVWCSFKVVDGVACAEKREKTFGTCAKPRLVSSHAHAHLKVHFSSSLGCQK